MLAALTGTPQLVALAVLIQRIAEEFYSASHTRALLAAGASEYGADYYPVVAVTHLAWIASVSLLIPPSAAVIWPVAVAYLLLQVVRYWVIGTLGKYWTHRIITLPGAPIVRTGPYAWIRHPNYAVTMAEAFLLPMIFGAWGVAVIMTAVWGAVVWYKIVLEDRALNERRERAGGVAPASAVRGPRP